MSNHSLNVEQDTIFILGDCIEKILQERINRLSKKYEGDKKVKEKLEMARIETHVLRSRYRELSRLLNEME